jgi:hypothetical protein
VGSGQRPAADHRELEVVRLLPEEVDDLERMPQADAGLRQRAGHLDGGQHAQDPVEPAAAGHGVGVRAEDQRPGRRELAGAAPDQVPAGVGPGLQPGVGHPFGQPGPRLQVRRGEGAPGPARLGGVGERRQRGPVGQEAVQPRRGGGRLGGGHHRPAAAAGEELGARCGRTSRPPPGGPVTLDPS